MTTRNPYGRKWRRVRAMVLARDGGVCRCAGECGMHVGPCRRPASQADHPIFWWPRMDTPPARL